MTPDAKRILLEARQLPPEQREWLTEQLLIESNERAFAALEAEYGELEPGYDEWFRKGVEEALADTSPGTPHEEVMRDIHQILQSARKAKKSKKSA